MPEVVIMERCSGKTFFLWIFKHLNAVVVDMFTVISRSSRKRCEICPVISIKAPPYLGYLSCWLWTDFTPCSSYFIIKFNLLTLFQLWSPGGNSWFIGTILEKYLWRSSILVNLKGVSRKFTKNILISRYISRFLPWFYKYLFSRTVLLGANHF